jgi:hypothetical protein
MKICPYCGLRKDDDDLNESQPGCRCDPDNEFELDFEGILDDGESFLREEKESRPIDANTQLKIIRCEGCGRTETVAPWKLLPCDGYTCAEKGCEQNPGFKLAYTEKGPVLVLTPNAAGSFWGYTIRDYTPEERKKADQLRAILVPALTKIN